MFDLAIRQIVVMLLGMGALAAVTLVGGLVYHLWE
jgi:hypothetical protein